MNFLSYIDPGTGSMMFTIIIGVVTSLFFAVRGLLIKFKFKAHGGSGKESTEKIPIVIFTDSKRYWNVFRPVCDELEKRGICAQYWTASPDDPALQEKYENIKCMFIGEGNRAFAKLNVMNASICLATTPGLDVIQWRRSRHTDYYAHTSHALDDGTMYRMFALDFYDCILASGENMVEPIRQLERMRQIPEKDIYVTGVTYMDEMKARWDALRKEWGQDRKPGTENEKTILCAPSWGPNSIFNKYGEKFLRALTDTGYKIIIRPHPQTPISDPELLADLQAKFPAGEKLEWNYDNDNFYSLMNNDMIREKENYMKEIDNEYDELCQTIKFDIDQMINKNKTDLYLEIPNYEDKLTQKEKQYADYILGKTLSKPTPFKLDTNPLSNSYSQKDVEKSKTINLDKFFNRDMEKDYYRDKNYYNSKKKEIRNKINKDYLDIFENLHETKSYTKKYSKDQNQISHSESFISNKTHSSNKDNKSNNETKNKFYMASYYNSTISHSMYDKENIKNENDEDNALKMEDSSLRTTQNKNKSKTILDKKLINIKENKEDEEDEEDDEENKKLKEEKVEENKNNENNGEEKENNLNEEKELEEKEEKEEEGEEGEEEEDGKREEEEEER